LGIIEWLDRTTTPSVEGQEQEGNGGGEGGWKGVVKGWYDEGQGKVGRVGRRYGLWQDGNLDIDDGGSSKVASKAGEGVANAVAAYVVVKVCPPVKLDLRYADHVGITSSTNRSLTRRSTNIRQMGFGTDTESGDEVDTQKRCITYFYLCIDDDHDSLVMTTRYLLYRMELDYNIDIGHVYLSFHSSGFRGAPMIYHQPYPFATDLTHQTLLQPWDITCPIQTF
jgi:hypothetical protein